MLFNKKPQNGIGNYLAPIVRKQCKDKTADHINSSYGFNRGPETRNPKPVPKTPTLTRPLRKSASARSRAAFMQAGTKPSRFSLERWFSLILGRVRESYSVWCLVVNYSTIGIHAPIPY